MANPTVLPSQVTAMPIVWAVAGRSVNRPIPTGLREQAVLMLRDNPAALAKWHRGLR